MKPKFKNIFIRREKSHAHTHARIQSHSHALYLGTAAILSGVLFFSSTPIAWALPSGGSVVGGEAIINQGGNTTTINQITDKAIIDWQKFGISADEALHFLQPGQSSVILNRVTGNESSSIFGELTANGRVFIINPNGILFGAGSSIDVAGLVATTLNIKNEDFMSGNYSFTQDEAAKLAYVVNEGRITIGDNGFAYLVAPGVQNKGIIVAKAGQVVMASGKQAYIDFSGDGLVKFKVSGKVTEKIIGPDGKPMTSAVSNSGTIKAQGGKVLLSGDAARDVVTSVVNNSGVIEASSFDDIMGGSVHLVARKNGDVINSGKISVSGKGKGKGSKAGSVVLSGENVGQFGEISADSKEGNAGSIDLRASNVVAMSNDSITTANAIDRGNGGTILVIGENSVRIGSGALLQARGGALGGDGGFIETSGHKSFEIGSAVDVSATAGKAGTWLIDPADLEIVSGNTETNIDNGSGAFSSTADSAKLGVELITTALAKGNLTIQTGNNGTQKGDITVNAEIVHTTTGDVTLTLNAHNDIIINKNISEGGSDNFNLNFVAGGNVSLADNVAITTNNGSFTSQGLNFSMANATNATNGSSINTGTGAILINNTGSISLSSLNAGDIQVTQAGGITIGGTVNSTDKISLVANTGNITTSSSGLIKAKSLNLETKGTENASIGDVKYTLDSNGKTTVSLIGLNVDVNYLTASTQSGISGKVSTGNIIIENKSTGDLTLGNITTNGDKGDNDIASVIIKSSGGKITSSNNTLVDAFSASFVAKNDIDVNTKLSALNAETTSSGSITINNTSKSLFILGLIAREYGNTAILNSNDDIQVINTNNQYVNGTKNISITSTGELGIQGDISATQNVSIESKNGSIINIINDPEIHVPTITSNALSLRAAGTIGALGGALRTVTGTRIDASAGTLTIKDPSDPNKKKDIGGVYLEEMNRLNIGTITATGTEGNVNLKSVNGNAYFAHSDSKITADKSVTILATGDILTHASNSSEVIDAKSVNLIANSIGSLSKSIKTKTGALTVQSTNEVSGSISITNSMELTSIKVITLGGPVDIDSTGADLKFGQDEKLSITNGTGTTLNFSNTLGGIKFNNIDLGTNDLTLNAARAITQSSGKLTAGNVTITAGENIGTSTKSLQTQVSSLTLTSGMNGIFIDQISNGTLKLNAVASGNDSDIKIIQTGSGNMEIKNVISKKGGVTLQSSGSIFNDNTYLSDVNISGNSLNLTAVGSIGADKKALITKVSNAGANAVFTANTTQGQIVIENSGNITLNASTSGDINFSNEGDIALGILNAGDKNDISLKAKGTITDANGADVNITANNLDLRATSVATNADKLDILVKKLDITTTNGGLYINQTGSQDFYLNSATSMGTASIEAQGTIQLGVINAIGQSIILKSANGDILDNRSSNQQAKANVNAKSLDISAKELGTKLNPLNLNVDILSSSSSGNTFAENMGSLHVTSDSLTSKGIGKTVSLIASNITVFNNSGGTTTLDMNGSLELIAKNGNIIFLNTDDTIAVTGNGSILLEALGTTPPKGETGLVGLIVAGNLKTGGGDITLNASSHISINLLDAGSGNVSVISNNGLIIDNNGAKGNIIANEVTLSGKSLSDQQLVDDKATAISNVGDKNLNLNLQQQMWQYAKGDVATYKGLVDLYTQLYNASLSSVDSTQKNLDTAEQHANTLYEVFKGLTAGFDAANLAASILEIPTGAAQAVPITGDGGSALAMGIAKSVLAGLQAALNQAERASDTAQDNVASLATQLMGDKSDLYTNKQSLDTNQTILDSKTVELNDLTGKVEKAEIALDASQIINNLTQQAANNNNVIGSSSQALGIQANKVNATANGQSNVYIESSSSLGVGDIIAHGNNTVVEVTAQNDISLIGKTESSKNIVLYSKEGKITSEADAKLVSNDLIAVAKQGIGTKGQAVNTQVKRLAASTETGGAYFVNTNGNEALSIDEISVNSKNLTKTVTGVSAKDDIQIQTTSDLVLNKTVSNTSKQGTVTLTATKGSILGTANNPPANHIVGGTLVATAQNGIGSDSVALRTDIAKLTGTVTGEGLVNIVEQNAIELTNITSANGSIKVTSNNGDIDVKKVVSSTDAAGNTIELTSNNGNIIAGTITAGAKHGDITLNASSGQVNNDGNTSTRITGHNLVIAANSGIGAVGTNANISLDTSVAQLDATTTTGLINISEQDNLDVKNASTGDGNITIASAQGDLNITKIVASGKNNTVTLAAAGKIADATIPGTENGAVISAANLSATAGNGIGEANNLIEIKVDNLEAKTTNGGVYFNDLSGDLQIGGVTPNLGKPALNGIEATAGDIVIKTAGAMLVSETVTAGNGNILLSANGGDVTTDAAVAATAGNITMTASKDVNINETVTAGNNVSLTATDGDITTNAAIKATQGNVTMDAGTNIALNGAVTASKDVSLNATSGNIKTTATVDAGNNVTMDAGTNIALDGAVTATKDVSLTATSGDIKTTATVDAGNNVTMDAGTNIALDGAVTATKDVLLKANGGNITTTAKATTTGDNVTMDASKAIALNGAVTANRDVSLTATAGDIKTTNAAVTATTGKITMTAGTDIALDGAVTAAKDVSLKANGGNITTTAKATTTGDNVTMDASKAIALNGAVTANKDVLLTATAGDIKTINAAVTATTGKITMNAGTDIALDGAVTAAKDVSLKANGGNITTTTKATTTGDNVTMDASKAIALNGAVTANRDVLLTAKDGDITTTAAVDAGNNVTMDASKAITLNGSVTADKDVLLTARNGNITTTAAVKATVGNVNMNASGNVSISGTVDAGTDVIMLAGRGIALNGAVTAVRDVSLKANDGDITTTKAVNAGNNVNMYASKNVKIDETVTAGQNILVTAKTGYINTTAAVTATKGDVTMNAGTDIDLKGAVTADKNVSLTANGGNITTTKAVKATTGNVSMTASENVSIGETVDAGNNVIMNAGKAIALNGAVTAAKDVSLTAQGGDITTTKAVKATTGNVFMTASENVSIGETVDAGTDVTMTAGAGIALNGAVTANRDVLLKANGGDITTTKAVAATNGNVTMDASKNVIIGETVDAGTDVTMTAGAGIALNGTVTADKNVSLTAKGGNITTTKAVAATNGNVTMDASENVIIDETVTAGNNVTMTAGAGIALNGAVTAANDVLLKANGGDITTTAIATTTGKNVTMDASKAITLNGAVTADNDVSLKANGGDITTTAKVAATNGNVTMDASGNVSIGGTVTAGNNVTMDAGAGIALNGAVTAVRDVLLKANGGDITTTATVAATNGNVTMDASKNVSIGETVDAGTDVTMTAGAGIALNGAVTAAKDVSLTAKGGNITTTKAVKATTGNVSMDASENVSIGETVDAGNNVNMTAGAGIALNGAVTAANDVLLKANGGDITTTAIATTTGKNVTMNASKAITLNGAVTADNDVSLKANSGDITTTAKVAATNGNVTMGASGNVTINETVTAGNNVTMDAGAGIALNGAVTAANDVSLKAKGGDITTTAAVAATNGNVSMDASKNVNINETVTAGNNVTMDAGTGIALNGAVTATNDVALKAKGGDITTTAAVAATNGNVSMDASKNVIIGETVDAGNNVTMDAGAGIALNGAVTANNDVSLKAKGGDITTTATVAATNGNVTLDASGNVNINETVTADQNILVTANTGNITTTAAVAAMNGNVDMTAGTNIALDGTVTANNDVSLKAKGGDITTTKAVKATMGNVGMTAGKAIALNGAVTAGKDVSLTANGGDITTTAAVAAGTDVIMTASAGIALAEEVKAGNNVSLTATGGDITTTAAVKAGNDVDMIAGKGITIGEVVTARAGNISMLASGNDITLNQTLNATNGNVSLEATNGAIQGTPNNPPTYHVVAKELKAKAAKGIGSGLAALRTNISKIVGILTGKGDIVISQTGDLDADLTTTDGAITVDSTGKITATNIVSTTDSDNNDITLTSKTSDILVGNISAGQGKEADVILNAEQGSITAIRPGGKPIISDNLIAVAKSGIDLDTTVNSAHLTVTHNGNIKINETDDLILNSQTQGDGFISIVTGGKLEGVNVVANNGPIDLTSMGDLIATHVVSTTNAIGNDITMTSNQGDIIVDYIAAGTGTGGNVTLKAEAGKILEQTPQDTEVDIIGNQVNLHAKGDIGNSVFDGIDIDSEILNAYSTEGNISLADIDDIMIHELHAKKGTVKVSSGGAILDDHDNTTKIIAKDLILESVDGIGIRGNTSTQALDTEVETLTASVTKSGDINIDQNGNLAVKNILNADGDITLVVHGNIGVDLIKANGKGNTVALNAIDGAITDINDDAIEKRLNISSDKVKLAASLGVGTKANPLEIATSELSAKGGLGGLYITNLREGLTINDYTTDQGDIVLTTLGKLVINKPVTNLGGGDISLTITDTGRNDDNIVLNANISAVGDGSIYLNADDSVYQNANITVENKSNVQVSAGDSIYMANGTSTSVNLGNIIYKANNVIELGKLSSSINPHYGSVTVNAPIILNNNAPGEAAINSGYIFVNTNQNETKDLIVDLIGGKDNSYGIWLNKRLVGGLLSRDTTFIGEPCLDIESKQLNNNLFHMNNKYDILPMEPGDFTKKGFIYDEESGTWKYKK